MTADERATLTSRRYANGDGKLRSLISQAITEAVAEEREKFSTLIDEHIKVLLDLGILKTSDSVMALKDLAASICEVKP